MLPIYRQRDGVDTKIKNLEVFRKSSEILLRNRSLLVFGEGVSDDDFVRRLKPLKKGALRIGFTALEACDWKKDIYLAAVGCNYSDPAKYRSDVLLKNSEKIHLNLYRKEFEENPNKVIKQLTDKLEELLKANMIHVDNLEDTTFTERLLHLSRKGMPKFIEDTDTLEHRWDLTKKLIDDFNANPSKYESLKSPIHNYFEKLEARDLNDGEIYDAKQSSVKVSDFIFQFLKLPVILLGALHCGIFYYSIKAYVESNFSRPVFWGSTKLVMMIFICGLSNLAVFFVLPKYIGFLGTVVYFLTVPLMGFVFHSSLVFWRDLKRNNKINAMNLSVLLEERLTLRIKIAEITNE
tara:strand:+ start:1 stop:1050 length:1050 start_codon:yes stop_codon:yes gene_type:complete